MPGIHKCRICSKQFASQQACQRHELRHQSVRNYKCEICGREFTQKCHMKRHLLQHGTPSADEDTNKSPDQAWIKRKHEPVLCQVCGKMQYNQDTLERHMLFHQGEQECPFCAERISSYRLRSHVKSKHHEELKNATAEQQAYYCYCGKCHKSFPYPSQFKVHMQGFHGHDAQAPECCTTASTANSTAVF